jgi:hypothetical protein
MKRMFAVAIVVAVAAVDAKPAQAQSDFQIWTEAGVKKKINKAFRVSAAGLLRFDDNASRVKAAMPEAGLSYRAQKWLRFGTGYRLERKRDNSGTFETRHRLHLEGRLRYNVTKSVRLEYRLRYQESIRSGGNRHDLRNRLGASWQPSDLGLYGKVETFTRFGNGNGAVYRKLRFTVGANYDFGDFDADLYYRIEDGKDDPTDPTVHIVGLAFYYSL